MTDQNTPTTEEKVFAREAQVLAVECPRCSSHDFSSGRCYDCGYPVTSPVVPPRGAEIIYAGPAQQLPPPAPMPPDSPFQGEFAITPPTPENAAEARAEVDRRFAAGEWGNL